MSSNSKNQRPTSRPSTPSRSSARFVSPKSRSRSSLPQPRVLPFPDIPVRPLSVQSSKANSRAPSPSHSSSLTRRPSIQHVRLNMEHATNMSVTASSDSADGRGILNVPALSPPTPSPRLTFATPTLETSSSRFQAASSSTSSSTTRPIPVPNVSLGSPSRAGFSSLSLSPPSIALPGSNPTTNVPSVAFEEPEHRERPLVPVKRNSGRSSSRPPALQITPSAPHTPLADHMHSSFLKGTCADVRLIVPKWGVAYNVHKMVLTQATFFHSLFLGGFSETSGHSKGKRRADDDWNGEVVELTFDDPNIVRAAFEICLSRLYSPHPYLQFPTHLLPTPQHPLTQSFPVNDSPSLESIQSSLPVNTHLATPRLLLSILATAIYLGHGSLMHEAITIVLRTVGPCTVNRYLGFAQGDGIGEEEWPGQSQSGAKDLGVVAHTIKRDSVHFVIPSIHLPVSDWNPSSSSLSDDESKVGGSFSKLTERSLDSVITGGEDASIDTTHELPHFYGFTGNKIGEACSCWIARWGVELLDIETSLPFPSAVPIWAHHGLPSTLVRAVLSSDSFFVKTEMDRYKVARRVLDLRRKGWELEMEDSGDISFGETTESDGGHWMDWSHDEEELAQVFSDGIYYTHMTFEELTTIAADIDPHTSAPFVPLAVLQAAHWAAADLRNRIVSPELPDELSLITTAASLAAPDATKRKITPRSLSFRNSVSNLSAVSNETGGPVELFHPVPADDTYRIGAGGLMLAVVPGALPGISDFPDLGPEPDKEESSRPSRRRSWPQGEKTAFGLARGCRTRQLLLEEHALSLSGLSLTDTTSTKWSKSEPFRFSVEFWGLDRLAEKERAYSETYFYAGSWFNVYVQTMRKKDKGTQLGIYLHRQNPAEVFPRPCTPRGRARSGSGSESSSSTSALGLSNTAASGGLYRAISTTPVALGSPTSRTQSRSMESLKDEPAAPYKDPRRVTRAYFSISCASALGTALIRFSSAPDNFTNSQSWGWKSSALRSEEYLSTLGEESLEEGVLGWLGDGEVKEGSLRANVVVGVV